jgi:protein-disulfide isomerase
LYANQPREGTEGLSDAQIADIATQVGVPADVADTFTEGTYRDWVAQNTQDAFETGVDSTPTVKVNGVEFTGNWAAPGELAKAVEAAAAASGK